MVQYGRITGTVGAGPGKGGNASAWRQGDDDARDIHAARAGLAAQTGKERTCPPSTLAPPSTLRPCRPHSRCLTASKILGVGKNKTYALIEAGEYPVRVLPIGGTRFRVSRVDLLAYLGYPGASQPGQQAAAGRAS